MTQNIPNTVALFNFKRDSPASSTNPLIVLILILTELPAPTFVPVVFRKEES